MKSKVFLPFLVLAGLILFVGLACITTPTPTVQPPPEQSTLPPEQPTLPPGQPTEPPTGTQDQMYFTEEFDQDPGWTYFTTSSSSETDASKATYKFDSGRMVFDIQVEDLAAYYIYEAQVYEDVRLDINVDNRGVNSQAVSLICRYSGTDWYLTTMRSDGLWQLWAHQAGVEHPDAYTMIQSGGSTAIKQGKAVNEYGMACVGDKIYVYINGVQPKGTPITERKFAFRQGSVGVAIHSFSAIPVKIEVDWFKVSQP